MTGFGPGCWIRLHCVLRLAGGEEVLSTLDEGPLEFSFGDGCLQPGLENLLRGLTSGIKTSFDIAPGMVWGLLDEALVQVLEASDCPPGFNPEPGQFLAFELPNGQEIAGRLLEVVEGGWRFDFNHPLAGKALVFEVEVLEVG